MKNNKKITSIKTYTWMIKDKRYTPQTRDVYGIVTHIIEDVGYCVLENNDIAKMIGSENPGSIGNCLSTLYYNNLIFSINVCLNKREKGRIIFNDHTIYKKWLEKYNKHNLENHYDDHRWVPYPTTQQRIGREVPVVFKKNYFNIDGMTYVWDDMKRKNEY